MKSAIKNGGREVLRPLARLLANVGVSANGLTWTGLAASGAAGALLAAGRFRGAALALLAGALCDVLDGSVARLSGRASRFGAFLDSTVDRVAELFVFAGMVVYFGRNDGSSLYPLLAILATGGSFLVSYTRARAEGLGISCSVGWMERPERLVVLLVAIVLGPGVVRVALWVLTVLTFFTAAQRMIHVHRETRSP